MLAGLVATFCFLRGSWSMIVIYYLLNIWQRHSTNQLGSNFASLPLLSHSLQGAHHSWNYTPSYFTEDGDIFFSFSLLIDAAEPRRFTCQSVNLIRKLLWMHTCRKKSCLIFHFCFLVQTHKRPTHTHKEAEETLDLLNHVVNMKLCEFLSCHSALHSCGTRGGEKMLYNLHLWE